MKLGLLARAALGALVFAAAPLAAAETTTRAADAARLKTKPQVEAVQPTLRADIVPVGPIVECAAFLQDLWAYVNANKGASEGAHRIGAKMAAVKIRERSGGVYPWGHGSYSEGAFGWSGANLQGRFVMLFSDRKTSAGARFDKAQSDIQDVTLYTDGRVEIMLRSWGNAILKLEALQCYNDGFLTGIAREGNGVSFVSFALRKEVITAGSHPSALWP